MAIFELSGGFMNIRSKLNISLVIAAIFSGSMVQASQRASVRGLAADLEARGFVPQGAQGIPAQRAQRVPAQPAAQPQPAKRPATAIPTSTAKPTVPPRPSMAQRPPMPTPVKKSTVETPAAQPAAPASTGKKSPFQAAAAEVVKSVVEETNKVAAPVLEVDSSLAAFNKAVDGMNADFLAGQEMAMGIVGILGNNFMKNEKSLKRLGKYVSKMLGDDSSDEEEQASVNQAASDSDTDSSDSDQE
jgi:hypothetical protein